MNFNMLNLQKAITAMKATPKPPNPVQSGGFGFVFGKAPNPHIPTKVKPGV